MTDIRWDPALAIGHEVIDAQHEEIFGRLGGLVAAMSRGDVAEIGRLFEFLGGYVQEHFREEEELMAACGFPGFGVHRAAHQRFVREYGALRELFDRHGASRAVAIKTATWVLDWLTSHIAATDQQMARHVVRRAG